MDIHILNVMGKYYVQWQISSSYSKLSKYILVEKPYLKISF